jgi:hypothetical protein
LKSIWFSDLILKLELKIFSPEKPLPEKALPVEALYLYTGVWQAKKKGSMVATPSQFGSVYFSNLHTGYMIAQVQDHSGQDNHSKPVCPVFCLPIV